MMMDANSILLIPVLVLPVATGLLLLFLRSGKRRLKEIFTVTVCGLCLVCAILMTVYGFRASLPWLDALYTLEFALDRLGALMLIGIAGFSFLVALYSAAFMRGSEKLNRYYACLLLTLGLANGVVLAANLFLLLFFWEALLIPLAAFISAGKRENSAVALKAVIITAIADLFVLAGIVLTIHYAGSARLTLVRLPLEAGREIPFLLLAIGACARAGALPFHTWIPDAAVKAPLPFMALLPAALEKLLGIYLLARVCLDLFVFTPGSWLSPVLMTLGAATILVAVMMALVQSDYKRLLSYHAVSQVGYMILGIGSGVAAGIAGGLFHMLNHALYKSGLFLTAGNVEKQTGSTDLHALSGLARQLPVTAICFVITALSICGCPPLNGFFSKELIYEAALERHWIFYACALGGSLFTTLSFLKLGHAVFFGKPGGSTAHIKEANLCMLLPMLILAGACIFFGAASRPAVQYIFSPLPAAAGAEHAVTAAPNLLLTLITAGVLLLSLLLHWLAARRAHSAFGLAGFLESIPGSKQIYHLAAKGCFDPYKLGRIAACALGKALYAVERAVNWLVTRLPGLAAESLGRGLSRLQNGNHSLYMLWIIGSVAIMILILILSL